MTDGAVGDSGAASERSKPRLLIAATVPVTFEAFLSPFGRHFRSLGWGVDAMAAGISASPSAKDFDAVFDVEWSRDPLDPRNLRSAARRVRDVVAEGRYDLVHVHTPVAAFVTRFALRRFRLRAGVRVIYTAHGFHFAQGLSPARNAVFVGLERLAGRWTDDLVVINREDMDAALGYRIVPPGRLRLTHGIGVDTSRFSPDAVRHDAVQAIRSELAGDGKALLLMVAEFTPNKRHAAVLRAFARTSSGAHLAFAGEGPTLEDSRKLAEQLGVGDGTHFLGYRKDVPELLAASDVTVLFSAREGLPRSSMESLAMGVPVLGPDIRGVRDLLEGGCGLLVPAGDEEALARAMDESTADAARAREMGLRGREKMAGEYSLPAILAEHERLYAEVLSRDAAKSL